MYLVKTVGKYTNKYFQKSLVGVIILREELEKGIALNAAAFFPPWRWLKTSTITVVSFPWTMKVASTMVRTTISLCSQCESNISRNRLFQQDFEASGSVAVHIPYLLRKNDYVTTREPTAFWNKSWYASFTHLLVVRIDKSLKLYEVQSNFTSILYTLIER